MIAVTKLKDQSVASPLREIRFRGRLIGHAHQNDLPTTAALSALNDYAFELFGIVYQDGRGMEAARASSFRHLCMSFGFGNRRSDNLADMLEFWMIDEHRREGVTRILIEPRVPPHFKLADA